MTKDQKIVATGAATGIVAMILLVWLLTKIIQPPAIPDSAGDRLAYSLPWAVVAILPLFAMLVSIGNARFFSEAIDPTLGKESQRMIVDGRVADNTLQQTLCFLVGMSALAVTLPIQRLNIVAAVSITFVISRLTFWFGYRIHPLYRAPGFSSTAYLNLFMFIAVLWMWLS